MVGIIMGLIILATLFLVPFGSAVNSQTLFGMVSSFVNNMTSITASGNLATIVQNYILLIAFVFLLIAGFVGIFPLGTGVLGVVAMVLITVGPYLVPGQTPGLSGYGIGYYIFWVASIVSLGASFWHGKRKPDVVVQTAAPPPPPPPPPPAQS